MRVAFMGTPDLAATSLRALLASRHEIVAVVSQPDRPSGRGRTVSPTPVASVARTAEVPLLQPPSVGTPEFRAWLAQYTPDIAVVAAFGRILGPKLLALPRLGSINVHASLLPRWRGASPIQAAIIAGDAATGVTIMQMVRELDAGDVLHAVETPIAEVDTAATLHDRLAEIGGAALLETLDQIEAGGAVAVPQDEALVTYAHRIAKTDGDLDWSAPAVQIARTIRGLHPWPGTRTRVVGRATQLKVHPPIQHLLERTNAAPGTILSSGPGGVDVACGDGGVLRLLRLQAPGKKPLEVSPFLSGFSLAANEALA